MAFKETMKGLFSAKTTLSKITLAGLGIGIFLILLAIIKG